MNRRTFLAASTAGLLASTYSSRRPNSQLHINSHDWLNIPYESRCFQIIGSTDSGMTVLPELDQALIVESKRIAGIELALSDIRNIELVDSCGLFTIYTLHSGIWKKFRFWNYIDSEPPEYYVVRAG